MRVLGTLKGDGKVFDGDEELCEVSYEITVLSDNRSKQALGTIRGGMGDLYVLFDREMLTLKMQNGATIRFICKRLQGEEADIRVSGPVPGF